MRKVLMLVGCLALVVAAACWGLRSDAGKDRPQERGWSQVLPGVWRSPGLPAGYALVEGDAALLVDCPVDASGIPGVRKIEGVILTHHHRDSCAAAGKLIAGKVPVRAPRESAPWLTPAGVEKYWQESLPLRSSRTAYLVVPQGFSGLDCSLTDGQSWQWRGWTIEALATPGHSFDHFAYLARKGKEGKLLAFCGDALAGPGKMWSPYTTDWDHWTDAGLKPAAESLRRLIKRNPAILLPAHGPVIREGAEDALVKTHDAVEEVGFLKSFECYTKFRLKNPPQYRFLAREQAESNGSLPWVKISPHLFLTGNTYVLRSRDGPYLVVDPWDPHSARQIPKLEKDQQLGPMEVVLCSHAHYDHYDGVYSILKRSSPKFWTLDHVAGPIAEPFRYRAPFLDARPVKVDRRVKDGETVTWREYRLKFHYFPGQTDFTTAVETEIDGKRCLFTADNFFHQDMFSGSGGWMGLNRSSPLLYAYSAEKVLRIAPEWVLAEHGGPFEFNAEDFRRRARWGKEAARAADALSPSGDHRRDWNPHRVCVEPLLQNARPGATLKASLVVENPSDQAEKVTITLHGRGVIKDQNWDLDVPASKTIRRDFTVVLPGQLSAGRHVFVLSAKVGEIPDGSDAFLVAEVRK